MTVLKPSQNTLHAIRPFQFSATMARPAGGEAGVDGVMSRASDGALSRPSISAEPQQIDNAADERLALMRRITELEEEMAKAASLVEDARKEGIEKGRKLGREEAETRDQERLELLREAIKQALSETHNAIADKNELAVDIARATLARILGNQSAFAAMVAETAAYWHSRLADTTIVKLRVSPKDFSNRALLDTLGQDRANVEIQLDDTLDHGACIFDLKLGEVDASIPVQAAHADETLKKHGGEGTAS